MYSNSIKICLNLIWFHFLRETGDIQNCTREPFWAHLEISNYDCHLPVTCALETPASQRDKQALETDPLY